VLEKNGILIYLKNSENQDLNEFNMKGKNGGEHGW